MQRFDRRRVRNVEIKRKNEIGLKTERKVQSEKGWIQLSFFQKWQKSSMLLVALLGFLKTLVSTQNKSSKYLDSWDIVARQIKL